MKDSQVLRCLSLSFSEPAHSLSFAVIFAVFRCHFRKCQVLCVFVCVYTQTHPYLLFFGRLELHTHTHSHKHILMCFVYINTHIHTHTHTHTCVRVYIYTPQRPRSQSWTELPSLSSDPASRGICFFWVFMVFLFFNPFFCCSYSLIFNMFFSFFVVCLWFQVYFGQKNKGCINTWAPAHWRRRSSILKAELL